jgi:hypothetical protein
MCLDNWSGTPQVMVILGGTQHPGDAMVICGVARYPGGFLNVPFDGQLQDQTQIID